MARANFIVKAHITRDNSVTISNMGKVTWKNLIVFTKEISRMIKNVDMEPNNIKMEMFMLDLLKMI